MTAIVRMLAILAALFAVMKAAVAIEWQVRTGGRLSAGRWLAFTAAWPGMDPGVFAPRAVASGDGARVLARDGLVALFAGGVLLCVARAAVAGGSECIGVAIALPALSLILHFGIFGLLAGFWRARGAATRALFDRPWRSTSLGDFWGRRWNRAFSEMTASLVYRKVARRAGPFAGLGASFLFSGILHELAISVPVGAGYGGPLAYFLLHGALVGLERRGFSLGRAGAWAAVLLPLPLLFHPPFLRGVVLPVLH